ncbi:hypothetical protein H0E87_008958 [Populus deltoides]|uniref:Uncharacterized protein n=1 Tax=Populus deltoides TaxID=3696 RepID=A0A8T2Z2J2_POPDE|nr:hypothetical protein H0E87_008958 [Populus deltoides]
MVTKRAGVIKMMMRIVLGAPVSYFDILRRQQLGGFGSYLFGVSEAVAKQSTEHTDAFKNPSLSWMIGFQFVVSFLGLFSVVPLRKVMIVDFKLTYPSGTATAHLINSFHTPAGAKLAKKQVKVLGKFFSFSFLWGVFQWFYTAGDGCGFASFPSLGLKAYENQFFFDFSATYVGVGMICPYIINVSVLLGGILSWGLMWPLIDTKKGDWYPADLKASSLHGLQGYKVFIAIALILGDGLYNFFKVLSRTLAALFFQLRVRNATSNLPIADRSSPESSKISYDEQQRARLFLKDQIPTWFSIAGYVAIAATSTATLPHIFHELKWYYILVIYIFAPALAFCLAACGVMMNIVSTASDLSQDFKTGYLTLSSPRSMFVSQLIGTAMGCIISPSVFWLFFKDLGTTGSQYPAPYATVYRNMAIYIGAILINLIKDALGKKWARFIPNPMAMAIPFYIGSYFAIDMCLGSLILFIWEKIDKVKADAFGPAVASGLICGDGIWNLPSSILALAGVKPPICMKFLSRRTNSKVDAFLGS